ncbi:sodium:solute symporter family protein [Alkalibacter mobilis]|uniref:sodium:solute symporter family protein n=1 Tax=Alkalibacter mobilis TaxID=2787712 RepID=UPI0018A00C08|nr:sodium:solute symporter family protein [Alkalibacter mobilis]MBF7096736.1 sodium:solute symporter family protein [Alkalibacter mobilis]
MKLNLSVFLITSLFFIGAIACTTYFGKRRTKNALDLTVGGRNIGGLFIALSYGASLVSTSAIVGFGGVAGLYGYSLYWGILGNMLIGTFIAFYVYGRRVRVIGERFGAESFPQLMGKRFESKFLQKSIGVIIYVFLPAYTSIILIGGANFVAGATGIDYKLALIIISVLVLLYVSYGGLIGVIYTDALLASIMFLSSVILLGTILWKVGGITTAHNVLDSITHLIPNNLVQAGHNGWVWMPDLGSTIWWTVMSTLVLGISVGTLAQPHLQVKFMAVKSEKNIYIGIVAAAIFIWFLTGGYVLVGIFSNVYFYNKTGQISLFAAEGNVDMIIPMTISSLMPEWFVYLFMFGLLAAALSSSASLLHLQGVAFARDIFDNFNTEKNTKRMMQLGIVIGLSFGLLLAFVLPAGIIARATVFWFGICAICWLPSYTGCLFWKGSSKAGAIASVYGGLVFALFWYGFVKASEAVPLGICMALTGKPVLFGHPWSSMDPMVIGVPLSALIFIVVSIFTKKPDNNL